MEKKKKTELVGVVVGLTLLAGLILAFSANATPPTQLIESEEEPFPQVEKMQFITQRERLNIRYGIDRSDYALGIPNNLLFGELPTIPEDFGETWYMFTSNFVGPEDIDREYYIQPEFYESWERGKKNHYTNINPNYWTPYGYGVYPNQGSVTMATDQTATAYTFFKSGWGVETYQGIRLEMPSDYFETEITPNEFLLGPAYPSFSINPDWAFKIRVKIKPKPGTLPGVYVLRMNLRSPTGEEKGNWFREYRSIYVDAAKSFIKAGESPLVITVNLVEAEQ